MAFFSEDKLKHITSEDRKAKPHTILILDDEKANLTNLQGMLEQDYDMITASDGKTALELIQHDPNPERIHLIISDQRMPGLNGVEFLEQTITIIPRTIRIILTAFGS